MDFSQRSGLKTSVENNIEGSGFGEPGGTPPPRILRSTTHPPPPPPFSGIIPLHALETEYSNIFFVFVQV